MLSPQTVAERIFEYIGTFDLYTRWKLSKDLGSMIVYGEKGFGDKEKLAKAKAENKRGFITTNKYEEGSAHHIVMAHIDDTDDQDQSANGFVVEVVPSTKSYSEFFGKDYIVDISPEKVFVIFPDLTFTVGTDAIKDLSWQGWREVFEIEGILEKDIEGYTESLVSLDKLRRKIKDTTKTDGELKDLRRKLYGLAYVINENITN
ncbi:MAG: hypothetical protein ACI9BF_000835 [Candidatus Paceibacteria bacterium]|jgi:hypothetical protein